MTAHIASRIVDSTRANISGTGDNTNYTLPTSGTIIILCSSVQDQGDRMETTNNYHLEYAVGGTTNWNTMPTTGTAAVPKIVNNTTASSLTDDNGVVGSERRAAPSSNPSEDGFVDNGGREHETSNELTYGTQVRDSQCEAQFAIDFSNCAASSSWRFRIVWGSRGGDTPLNQTAGVVLPAGGTTISLSASGSVGAISGTAQRPIVTRTSNAVAVQGSVGVISGQVAVSAVTTSSVGGQDSIGVIGGQVDVSSVTTSSVTEQGSVGAISSSVTVGSSATTSSVAVQGSVGVISGQASVGSSATTSSVAEQGSIGTISASVTVGSSATTSSVTEQGSIGVISGQVAVSAVTASSVEEQGSIGAISSSVTVGSSVTTSSVVEQGSVGVIGGQVDVSSVTTATPSPSGSVGVISGEVEVGSTTATAAVAEQGSIGAISGAVGIGGVTVVTVSPSGTAGTISGQAGVGTTTSTALVSETGGVGALGGTVTVGVTAASASSVSPSGSIGVISAQVGVADSTPTATVAEEGSLGVLGGSVVVGGATLINVSASSSVGVISGSASLTRTTSSASVSGVGLVGVLSGTVTLGSTPVSTITEQGSVGAISAQASVVAITTVEVDPPPLSIGSASGSVDIFVIINLPAIDIDGIGDISDTLVRTSSLEPSQSIGAISGTVDVDIAGTSEVDGSGSIGIVTAHVTINAERVDLSAIVIDGVGDMFLNLLSRSEIMSVEEVWNTGLTQLGVGSVDSAQNDTSSQATLIRTVWPNFRKQFISDHAWNGCKTTIGLTALPDSDFKDSTRWSYIYSLPSDYIRALTVNGYRNQPGNSENVMWEIEAVANTSGVKSRCLCSNQNNAKLEYVFDVGDANIDLLAPAMKHAMGLALAAFVAPNFGKTANEIALLEQKVKEALLKARGIDGQENSARFFSPSELVESRYRSY